MQGLLTNDTKLLEAEDSPMQYAAILNSHGRYLHDLFLHRQKGLFCHADFSKLADLQHHRASQQMLHPVDWRAGKELVLLADVDKQGIPDLVKLLKRYALFRVCSCHSLELPAFMLISQAAQCSKA